MTRKNIMVIGMPRCGAHSLGEYLTKKFPQSNVIVDEYTFLTSETIRKNNLDKALKESIVYIILRKDIEHWIESFTAIVGKPPHETMIEFIDRMKSFCVPNVVFLEDYKKKKGFPHINKRNFETHPKREVLAFTCPR